MNDTALRLSEPPWILLREGDPSDAYEFAWRCADAGLTSRVLRGRKMRSEPACLDEISAVMQFPDYFGSNWPAAAECVTDLSWMPPRAGYLLVVTDAAEVLGADPPGQTGVLARILAEAGLMWATPVADGEWWDRPAIPFHVVLQTQPGTADLVRELWCMSEEFNRACATP